MGTYKLSNDAEADLDRIWLRGLKEYGIEQADKYYNDLFDRFEELADHPYLYQAVDDVREHEYYQSSRYWGMAVNTPLCSSLSKVQANI